ncbi:hypothetical protein [Ulvibacter litoralis]|uniref:Uncharacterized protein n=1 Tax=Ulvibacter litoralis TaxID=227084 RepID=A0A1G7I8M9_9FLAO|nr:hypothetical protein [Ulvibacter litoralis]GHC62133.1 hypothetical protein GCM10008083_29040 [Ulvibacter litoralis]SDF09127.1 hypothetical protein SAMN05421855_105151 [Ulvibacter litoralis]
MKIEHLQERVLDYKTSIETVVSKKEEWTQKAKPLLLKTLKTIAAKYAIGWKVQELNWIHNNEAVNISFESFPEELMDCTNRIPSYQFIPGGALVFTQTYSGDVYMFVLFPEVDGMPIENNMAEFGTINPSEVTEKMIIEKVDEFLKEMIQWEVPNKRTKMGYSAS